MKKLMIFVFGLFFATSLWAVPDGYQVITPDDTITFPTTLQGYTQRTFTSSSGWSLAGGGESTYLYLVLSSGDITVSGTKAYNNLTVIGSPTSTNTAAGAGIYYSGTNATRLRIRDSSLFTDSTTFDTYLKAHPLTFLYKITTPTNNEYVAVRNLTTGELGYYCESGTNAGSFVPVFGMTTSTPVSRCPVGQVERTYTTTTGTVTQNGTPTPTNPITPTFYTQGNMVLRKVGDIADSYDATTGKITRRVGVKVLNGTENWKAAGTSNVYYVGISDAARREKTALPSTHYVGSVDTNADMADNTVKQTSVTSITDMGTINVKQTSVGDLNGFKTFLAQQYDNGTPVKIYYVLATETTEDWPAEQCESSSPIKIATTKYNNTAFQPVLTALNNAVTTIKDVVANTINQATAVSNLQSGKQTMPDSTATNGTCPNYRQCLLVEDESGTPHWYEIMDPFYNLFSAVIPNNVSTDSVTSQNGVPDTYTQLEYIESTGSQYITMPAFPNASNIDVVVDVQHTTGTNEQILFAPESGSIQYLYTVSSVWRVWKKSVVGLTIGSGDDRHVFTIKTTPSSVEYYTDGVRIDGVPADTYNSSYWKGKSYKLGARTKDNGGGDYYWKGKIYSFTATCDGHVCMNLVPAKQGNDVGVYDTASGTFIRGNGSFIAGPEVQNQQALWTMTFLANAPLDARYRVNGSAICNATLGAANTAATSNQMSANNWTSVGSNCWCSIDMVTELNNNNISTGKNIWVWLEVPSGETCAADCASNCVTAMASGAAADKPFRQAMTGM